MSPRTTGWRLLTRALVVLKSTVSLQSTLERGWGESGENNQKKDEEIEQKKNDEDSLAAT